VRWIVLAGVLLSTSVSGQTPKPFPRPGEPSQPQRPVSPPATVAPASPQPKAAPPIAQAPADPNAPPAATVFFPVYPTAQFLASYDAGRGQRYYVYGATSPFADVVTYYRTQLDEKGNLVFREPPAHMFEIGRFREETMAFPPGVTVKDWTWGGSQGYPNPKLGAQPGRFPTIIIIVPPPPAAAPAR